MDILNRCLSPDEFRDYVKRYVFGTQPADKLVIHHTWRPTKESWQGQRTINGLKTYYEGKGWSAGPHLFVAEDGIWLFSPMRQDGIHAGELNHRSIGIEVVGDYDNQKWEGKTLTHALTAIKALMDRLGIGQNNIYFHRDVSSKSCPGWAITKEWLFDQLARFQFPGSGWQDVSAPTPQPQPEIVFVPEWAKDAVSFVQQNQLFTIRTDEDIRDAVKFYRLYQLIKKP